MPTCDASMKESWLIDIAHKRILIHVDMFLSKVTSKLWKLILNAYHSHDFQMCKAGPESRI